jgi:hypothetical protein
MGSVLSLVGNEQSMNCANPRTAYDMSRKLLINLVFRLVRPFISRAEYSRNVVNSPILVTNSGDADAVSITLFGG